MSLFSDVRPYFGQDPFVVKHHGSLLLVESQEEKRIVVREFTSLETMQRGRENLIWDDPRQRQVWAPELHQRDSKWYVYYAASDGENDTHRMFVLEADSPLGPYRAKGQIGPDIWGIDLTVFQHHGERFCAWSGWENKGDGFPQHIYVAPMDGPCVAGLRVQISSPERPWECSRAPINEGPQALHGPDGKLYLSFSANASWTQDYCVGLLELTGDKPLSRSSWTKHPRPLLTNAGHGCFVDDLYVYHRKLSGLPGWSDREIAYRPFTWEDGQLSLG